MCFLLPYSAKSFIIIYMAWGISPYRTITVPLGEYNADHYLTLLYTAFNNLNWRVGYFDHDGIIAYTPISWASYSEEVSVRVYPNEIVIKSECVGYQGFFTDYEKNQKNLDLLFGEIEYAEFHLQTNLEQTTQQLIDSIPEKQFLSLDNPPMAGKERLRGFLSAFIPKKDYAVTPVLVLTNIGIYVISMVAIFFMAIILAASNKGHIEGDFVERILLGIGFSSRAQILQGQVWRLLTNTFLHFSLIHLTGNMIVLVYIGSLIESKLGKWNFLLLYLFAGLMASMVSVMWRAQGIAGGASGAIFGLFGILLALLSTNFYERSARRALLISTGIFVAYNIIPGSSYVDYAAHVGGLLSGYVLGLIAYVGLSTQNTAFKKWGIATAGALLTVTFIGVSIWLTPNYQLKEYVTLNEKTSNLSNAIREDFYNGDSVSRADRLLVLDYKAKTEISDLYKIAATYEKLTLPGNKKQIANLQAKIIRLECTFYGLLYKEFKENDKTRYRKTINGTNDKINELRRQWGELENDSD